MRFMTKTPDGWVRFFGVKAQALHSIIDHGGGSLFRRVGEGWVHELELAV